MSAAKVAPPLLRHYEREHRNPQKRQHRALDSRMAHIEHHNQRQGILSAVLV